MPAHPHPYPRWSPDGTWLLIRVTRRDSVTQGFVSITGYGPFLPDDFDADGATWVIGNLALMWPESGGLYLVAPGETVEAERLLGDEWLVETATLLSDGDVLFVSDGAVYEMPLRGGQAHLLADLPDGLADVALSPDGGFATGVLPERRGVGGPLGRIILSDITTGSAFVVGEFEEAGSPVWGPMR